MYEIKYDADVKIVSKSSTEKKKKVAMLKCILAVEMTY